MKQIQSFKTTGIMDGKQSKLYASFFLISLDETRKKIPTKREHYLNGTPLATVSKIKDLGITVTNTLQWSHHTKLISSKAN